MAAPYDPSRDPKLKNAAQTDCGKEGCVHNMGDADRDPTCTCVTIDGPVQVEGPIDVNVLNFPDQITVDEEYICDEDLNTWQRVIHIYTNGVETSVTQTDTGISCDDPMPTVNDYETVEVERCNDLGTWKVVTFINSSDITDTVGPIFIDPTGIISTDPGDLTDCSKPEVIKVETKCSADAVATEDLSFIGNAADGSTGYQTTGWEAAVAGQTINLISPSPVGSATNWTDGDVLVEQVDYVTPTTPLSALTRRNITIENPVNQGGAFAAGAGFDNTSGSNSNINAFLISFTNPVGAMGATWLDTESDPAFAQACMELYDASENLLETIILDWGTEDGGGEAHFAGFTRVSNDVSYVLVKTGANASMTNELTTRLAFGDLRVVELQELQYTVVTTISTDGQSLSCNVYDSDKNLVNIDPDTLVDCVEEEPVCLQPVGRCKCYGSGTGDASYEIDDNETDGVFSIGATGTVGMKWEVDSPAAAADGLAEFTLAVVDCINSGGPASLLITDSSNNTYPFVADTVVNPGNADGSGSWYFEGPGGGPSGSGKITSVTLTCGNGSSGEACAFFNCETSEIVWLDSVTGLQLTLEQVATLEECPAAEVCEDESGQVIRCAVETGVTDQGTLIAVGDQLLTLFVRDCENVIQSSAIYHIPSGELVVDPVLADQCDPEPDIETVRECILDVNGIQWIQVSIFDPLDPSSAVVLFYDDNLMLGTPAGEPGEWESCVEGFFDIEPREICVEQIDLDGQTWIAGPPCNGFPVYYSTTTDQAILNEQTIVGGWAIVVASAIMNCGVEAAAVLGSPSVDPTTLSVVEGKVIEHTVYDAENGEISRIYYTVPGSDVEIVGQVAEIDCSCCPDVKENYICENGVKKQVWVSLDPRSLEVKKVVNAITLQEVVDPEFIEVCGSCDTTANRRCESYSSFFGGYGQFVDNGDYDDQADENGCPQGGSRNLWMRVRVSNASGEISDTVLGPYPVDPTEASYIQFLADLSGLTSTLGVGFDLKPSTPAGRGYSIDYNTDTDFGITFEQGSDDQAGGVCWHTAVKWAIKYQSGIDAQPMDSVNFGGDLANVYDNSWGWDTLSNVFPTENCVDL